MKRLAMLALGVCGLWMAPPATGGPDSGLIERIDAGDGTRYVMRLQREDRYWLGSGYAFRREPWLRGQDLIERVERIERERGVSAWTDRATNRLELIDRTRLIAERLRRLKSRDVLREFDQGNRARLPRSYRDSRYGAEAVRARLLSRAIIERGTRGSDRAGSLVERARERVRRALDR